MTADSRKVTLRMGAGLHRKLQVLAERENRSVNQQMIHIIQHAIEGAKSSVPRQ